MAIVHGKIELKQGAIAPATRPLWHAAAEKLSEAAGAIALMETAPDRIQYEAGWTGFVDSIQEFWTRFVAEGTDKFKKFPPWAGKIQAYRKNDELLQYLYQSRHQSQHGILSVDWVGGGTVHVGGPDFFGTVRDLGIGHDNTYQADMEKSLGSNAPFKLVLDPGHPVLPTIYDNKHGQQFCPPQFHLGAALNTRTPLTVARLALNYYEDVLKRGLQKFV